MSQTQAGYNWTYVGTVGTVVLSNRSTDLVRLVFPGTYVGTVMLYDSSTAAGTTDANALGTYGIPNTNVSGNVEVGIATKKGLVYTATGTPNLGIVWN